MMGLTDIGSATYADAMAFGDDAARAFDFTEAQQYQASGYINQNVQVLTLSPPLELFPKKRLYAVIKRFMDIFLSVTALIVLFPMLLITAIAIKLDSKGPVLYAQYRAGRNGKQFKMYKFRSMCADAEKKLKDLHHLNEKDGPVFKISKDPRVTKVGQFIRNKSIDELPQLFNILRGEMSIVGPRPPLINEVKQYNAYQLQRLNVTPGLTCYWQISGRSTLSFDEWIDLDIKYLREYCFLTDLIIFVKTIPAVLLCRGAC